MSIWEEKRRQAAEQLAARTQESHETRERSGKFRDFLRADIQIKRFNCGEGDHLLDILCYIAGENNPNPKVRPGDLTYVLDIWVHDGIGANEDQFVCLSRNYNQRCPICERQKQLKNEGYEWDDPQVKALEPRRRTLYNVLCYDNEREEAKGVQVWVVSHWNFERHVSELAKATPRGGGCIMFSHPDQGKSIAFRREGKKMTDTKYVGHRFVDRNYIIPNEILEQTHCLEDLINIPDYKTVYEAFYGRTYIEGEAAPPVANRVDMPAPGATAPAGRLLRTGRGTPPPQASQPTAPASTQGGAQPASRPAGAASPSAGPGGQSAGTGSVPGGTGAPSRPVAPNVGGGSSTAASSPAGAAAPVGPAVGGDVPSSVEHAGRCPVAVGVFGRDIDRLDACAECAIWDDCRVEADRLAEESRRNRQNARLNRPTR